MISGPGGLLRAAVALAPATLLRLLAEAAGSGERAAVSVHLSSGQVVAGLVVMVGTDRGHEVAVLADDHSGHLGYVLLANVAAVWVRAPELFQDILTAGRLPQPAPGEPVTRLGLRRDFAPSAEFPVQVDWAALPDSEPLLANLGRLLAGLREVVREVCADEAGKRAWAPVRALHVEHRDGAEPSVRRVPDGLSVQADLSAALPRDLAGQIGRQFNVLL